MSSANSARSSDGAVLRRAFESTWSALEPVGRSAGGGYERFAWTPTDLGLREWFVAEAERRGLTVEVDRSGNQWAWWGEPAAGAVVTGSHLDSVPHGGAFDGPLGLVSAFLAVDELRAAGVEPGRPLAIVNFFEEEGSRFGLACLGSRLLTGAVAPDRALGLRDDAGDTLADALARAGQSPDGVGPDPEALARIGVFVELHVEQGRQLALTDSTIAVASSIWPHGRWHFCFSGEANHAGSTLLADRRDPVLPFASLVGETRRVAASHQAVSTFGRVKIDPNGTNAIASRVDAWLDARGPDDASVEKIVDELTAFATAASSPHGVGVTVERESWTPIVEFDVSLADRLVSTLGASEISAPVLHTAAGHDSGVLAAHVPTAMLFVRNPTGVSHSPEEHAEASDCVDGVVALTAVLRDLLTGPLEVVA